MKLFCNSSSSSILLLIFFLFFSLSSSSNPDFETLLQFKKSSDPFNQTLVSWSNSSSSDPCSWVGITCNNERTRITQLVLENQNLTGSIQALTQLTDLRKLSLKNNNLSIPIGFSFSSWRNMKLLYLSRNQFSGKFPSGVSKLHRLHRIDLSYNQFTGEIPLAELIQLPNLLTVRLEMNSFTGSLTGIESLGFTSLIEFNVSRNNLEGQIPEIFSSFQDSSFVGNKNLCGKPLLNDCGGGSQSGGLNDPIPVLVPPRPKKVKKLSKKSLILITVSYVFLTVLMGFVGFLLCTKKFSKNGNQSNGKKSNEKKKMKSSGFEGKEEEGKMVLFNGCLDLSVDDLLKSSAELLGKGSFGTTYKVMMNNGVLVVVKRIRERKKKEIDGFLEEIGGLRHKNLSSLRGYYSSREELLLVYDYFSNGSLYSLLHGNRGLGRTPLDWVTRLRFASGVAEGLAFLHVANECRLSHGNLTSANVVIDRESNACVADAALCHIFVAPANVANNGYKAPELMHNAHNYRKLSQKCDVYSFGVVLLEILTGKMALHEGETSLAKWVQCVRREEWASEVFDFEIPRDKQTEDEMVCVLQIALLCVAQVPNDRPKMSVVCKMIEDVKTKGRISATFVRTADSPPSQLSDVALPTQNTSF
ncbi:hypothetical protein MKW94_011437 [Papaver nudicaule]|uniref:Protein kinase domain-containing protein n=1 Tax=Papaver nudicaule TaxID=74823 RepID=A0AA41V6F1_PAPNU|nr:hypothetical protein [Papaver nudicaule]MCL7050237.1 hypothetical protein [Papaver nudicaule]